VEESEAFIVVSLCRLLRSPPPSSSSSCRELKLMGSHAIALAHAVIGVVALLAEGMAWVAATTTTSKKREEKACVRGGVSVPHDTPHTQGRKQVRG
jgi:hypothetical protein